MDFETRMETVKPIVNELLPQAIMEYYSTGMIDDPFGYTLSDELYVNSVYADNVIVSISIHYLDDKGLLFCLFGIDEDNQIDLIDYEVPTEEGLERLVEQMCAIDRRGVYSQARAWQTMG